MSNRLAEETSPYLQQHADNPVDWYPWGQDALTLARTQDKPILLSVGYSACHWCHVMAHESFEDAATADVMNRLFVNIKVDREERPDLDQIYQSAHYLLTRRNGGWPLTMFLTPDGTPFAGGTYFPKTPRHGMPGFVDVLTRIEAVYRSKRTDIERQNEGMLQAFAAHLPQPHDAAELGPAPLQAAVDAYAQMFDAERGGLGQAPKFPHPYELAFLLRRHAAGTPHCLEMLRKTLTAMAEGGIFDHVGGGFCRYSTDADWIIPHFEKMLYDNGPLLALYADTARATGEDAYARVADATAAWVMREMQSSAGGYYSSLDADSEDEEGKFYVWTPSEVRALLTDEEYAVVCRRYGLDADANFEGKHWHLRANAPLASVAASTGFDEARCAALLDSARTKLLAAREERVRPARDEKILTSWNAIMIRAMAHAGSRLGRREWIASARRALNFVRATMWHDGRLLATHKDGKTHLNAYLDDYAFLLDAVIEMLQADFRSGDLRFASALADALLDRFEDEAAGGFYFTSHDHERLIHRPKPGADNATPAGNGIAAFALQRLGCMLGETRYLASAERTLRLFWPQLQTHAHAFPSLLGALEEYLHPPWVVTLRGPREQLSSWHDELAQAYRPHVIVLALPSDVADLPAALAHPTCDVVNAWVCEGVKCLPPLADMAELTRLLAESRMLPRPRYEPNLKESR